MKVFKRLMKLAGIVLAVGLCFYAAETENFVLAIACIVSLALIGYSIGGE